MIYKDETFQRVDKDVSSLYFIWKKTTDRRFIMDENSEGRINL